MDQYELPFPNGFFSFKPRRCLACAPCLIRMGNRVIMNRTREEFCNLMCAERAATLCGAYLISEQTEYGRGRAKTLVRVVPYTKKHQHKESRE